MFLDKLEQIVQKRGFIVDDDSSFGRVYSAGEKTGFDSRLVAMREGEKTGFLSREPDELIDASVVGQADLTTVLNLEVLSTKKNLINEILEELNIYFGDAKQ